MLGILALRSLTDGDRRLWHQHFSGVFFPLDADLRLLIEQLRWLMSLK